MKRKRGPGKQPRPHGTISMYASKCRCIPCKEAQRNYQRERRAVLAILREAEAKA